MATTELAITHTQLTRTPVQLRPGLSDKHERAVKRFLAKVNVTDSGCWLWTGAINDKRSDFPYGAFCFGGRKMYAHRAAFYLFRGPLRRGKEIMHSPRCESESCVNPDHLSQGLHSTNKSKAWTRRYWGDGKELG